MQISPAVIMGWIRHTLTIVGGILIARGFLTESTAPQLIGVVMSVIAYAWSMYAKQNIVDPGADSPLVAAVVANTPAPTPAVATPPAAANTPIPGT